MNTLGKRLKMLRIEKDLLQKEVADSIGCSVGMLSSYESDRREPNVEYLKKLADFFNVSVDYLVGKTTIKENIANVPEWVQKLPQDLQEFIVNEANGQFVYLRIAQNAKINDLPSSSLRVLVETFKRAYDDDKKAMKENKKNE